MREWRKTHPLTPEQKKKDNARSYAYVYFKRGKLHKIPCECCGSPKSQMHHEDYDKPLEVIWLCRPCHMRLHEAEKQPAPIQVTTAKPCPCGRGACREGQRNCHECNREANKKHRDRHAA